MARSYLTIDSFFAEAARMRAHFEERLGDPRSANSGRFIWDWWHVPNQYTALRTPAYAFFPKPLYERFHRRLAIWGREVLGAHDVSPPWMSCYVDGCRQELHGDLPHGPWAFVFSLTPWRRRRFQGGETILLREEILEHWSLNGGAHRALRAGAGLERDDVERAIAPQFNRLTVFDPRIPHGVREVRGAQGVLDGRLVIHGWFVQPRPFAEGPMEASELAEFIATTSERIQREAGAAGGWLASGAFTFRFQVERSGRTGRLQILSSTLRGSGTGARSAERLLKRILAEEIASARFRPRAQSSRATVPLIFAPA